jgi:hypothetical protein
MTAKKKPKQPRPKRRDLLPATGDERDVPHIGRAVKGCRCDCCRTHRRLARQDRYDAALERRRWP